MSLPLRRREWAVQLMPYGVRFTDIGHTGHPDWATLVRQKYRHGDEDDRASEREPLAPAPLLSNAAVAASCVGSLRLSKHRRGSVVRLAACNAEAAMFSHWPIARWARSVRRKRWESDEFLLRRNDLLTLCVNLLLMAAVVAVAFVACAVLQ